MPTVTNPFSLFIFTPTLGRLLFELSRVASKTSSALKTSPASKNMDDGDGASCGSGGGRGRGGRGRGRGRGRGHGGRSHCESQEDGCESGNEERVDATDSRSAVSSAPLPSWSSPPKAFASSGQIQNQSLRRRASSTATSAVNTHPLSNPLLQTISKKNPRIDRRRLPQPRCCHVHSGSAESCVVDISGDLCDGSLNLQSGLRRHRRCQCQRRGGQGTAADPTNESWRAPPSHPRRHLDLCRRRPPPVYLLGRCRSPACRRHLNPPPIAGPTSPKTPPHASAHHPLQKTSFEP
mmetsp:Transcript_22026/g.44167  ORF Transcript_22026/g.44167 Transcript_22026/m.44167 type:complete len:293 (+) Transcript_22026:1027-1905(+)